MNGVIYSTEHGRMCPRCSRPVADCACRAAGRAPAGDGIVRVARETKGRKGKGVTLISGVPLEGDELRAFAKKLKQACGTGGAIKDGVIELQGDHRDKLVALLEARAWIVKRAGG